MRIVVENVRLCKRKQEEEEADVREQGTREYVDIALDLRRSK